MPEREKKEDRNIEIPTKFDLSSLANLSRKKSEESKNALLEALLEEDANEAAIQRERDMKAELNKHLDSVDTDSLISNLLSSTFSFWRRMTPKILDEDKEQQKLLTVI